MDEDIKKLLDEMGKHLHDVARQLDSDLLRSIVLQDILRRIVSWGWGWIHMGNYCRTCSVTQYSRGGTRTKLNPLGTDVLPREVEANRGLRVMLRIV